MESLVVPESESTIILSFLFSYAYADSVGGLSFEELLEVFWQIHDPTTLNRQGPDIGTQYRSAIFYHSNSQLEFAKNSLAKLTASGRFSNPVVTEITEHKSFYRAEEYHQRYFEKMGRH